jgi:hypothetical protein
MTTHPLRATTTAVGALSAAGMVIALTIWLTMPGDWAYHDEIDVVRKVCFGGMLFGSAGRVVFDQWAKRKEKAEVVAEAK